MSSIAAKILGKYHEHHAGAVYNEVGHRHRLSYADLDALLDREEKQLALEKKEGREDPSNTPQNPLYQPGQRESASSSSESEDESDWPHEEEDLLELDDTYYYDHIQTVSNAEDHLIKDIDYIVHSDITEVQLARMESLLKVNCLHRGDIVHVKGKRWMVAVDGTEASKRAFQGVLKLMEPDDHLLVVTVRDKNLPQRFALSPSEEIQLRFELWKSARHILKPYTEQLTSQLDSQRYTVMIPDAWDARRLLCKLCQRYEIDTLVVGKHSKAEHNHHHWHLRSLHSYTSKHAKCHVIIF